MITDKEMLVFIGSCPMNDNAGIYTFRFNVQSGRLTPTDHYFRAENPSFLAVNKTNNRLYSVGEREQGIVRAFSINGTTGELTLINTQTTGGKGPCHLTIDSHANVLFAANYRSGSVSSMPILPNGAIGSASSVILHEGSSVIPDRQGEPHPHSTVLSPDEQFVFVQDLGTDKIMIYRLDIATAKLAPSNPPYVATAAGSGPRHFVFHPDGKRAYLINELNNTIIAYDYDAARGNLREFQTISALPSDFTGESYCADIHIHPSRKFLYGSNRGHDSIAIFRIEENTGRLTLLGFESTRGGYPRNFIIDPTGMFMIVTNQRGDNVVVFHINQRTGMLKPTGQVLTLSVPLGIRML
ncbi:MAG: lactonase family protein [Lentisphaerae bacterium]|nr:lactonase family protein [Lentisphaerota bacterium]